MKKNTVKIFILSCVTYIISGLYGSLSSVLASYFMGDVNMAPTLLGIFFSMGGVLTAVVASLPGRVVDKIGAKITLIAIAIGELISFLMFPLATNVWTLMISMGLSSFVTAFSVPCNTQVLGALGVKDPAKLLRVNMLGSSLAGIVSSFLAARMIDNGGLTWRATFFIFFAFSAVISIIGIIAISSVHMDFTKITVTKEKDENAENISKSYKYTREEKLSCIALCLLYIGYMGVGITISVWLPALLSAKGFTGVEASWPSTVGSVVQLLSYLLLPTLFAKALKTTKITPFICALLAVVVLGTMAVNNIYIVCAARGLLAICMGFLSMHVQSDLVEVAPSAAAGRFSSTVLASANAGGVLAVILTGFLSTNGVIALLMGFAVVGIIGAVMFIKPAAVIEGSKQAE